MGTRVAELQQQVATLEQAQLKASQEGKRLAAEHAAKPDGGLMAKAMKEFERAREIGQEIAIYDEILADAEAQDARDAQLAFEKANASRLAQLFDLAEQRVALARGIDKALAAVGVAQTAYYQASARIVSLASSCVATPGMLPLHRADKLEYIRQAALGMGQEYREALAAGGGLEAVAVYSAADLKSTLGVAV